VEKGMMRKIGFGLRFSALVIDVALVILIVFCLNLLLSKAFIKLLGIKSKTQNSQSQQTLAPSKFNRVIVRENSVQNQSLVVNIAQNTRRGNTEQRVIRPPRETTQPQIKEKRTKYLHNSKEFVKLFLFSVITFLFFFSEVLAGKSVGKYILRLKIFDNTGNEATKKQQIIRYASKIAIPSFFILLYSILKIHFLWTIGAILFFIATVGCFFVFSNSIQTLHDRLSGTAVFSLRLKEIEEVQEKVN